jgi:hypothetical protein
LRSLTSHCNRSREDARRLSGGVGRLDKYENLENCRIRCCVVRRWRKPIVRLSSLRERSIEPTDGIGLRCPSRFLDCGSAGRAIRTGCSHVSLLLGEICAVLVDSRSRRNTHSEKKAQASSNRLCGIVYVHLAHLRVGAFVHGPGCMVAVPNKRLQATRSKQRAPEAVRWSV